MLYLVFGKQCANSAEWSFRSNIKKLISTITMQDEETFKNCMLHHFEVMALSVSLSCVSTSKINAGNRSQGHTVKVGWFIRQKKLKIARLYVHVCIAIFVALSLERKLIVITFLILLAFFIAFSPCSYMVYQLISSIHVLYIRCCNFNIKNTSEHVKKFQTISKICSIHYHVCNQFWVLKSMDKNIHKNLSYHPLFQSGNLFASLWDTAKWDANHYNE